MRGDSFKGRVYSDISLVFKNVCFIIQERTVSMKEKFKISDRMS